MPEDGLDTIIFPAQENNFKKMLLEQNVWYPIGISQNMCPKLKYIAVYMGAPISSITHVGIIESIKDFEIMDKSGKKIPFLGKKIIKLVPSSLKPLEHPIPLIDKAHPIQSLRYAQYEKILSAKSLSELFSKRKV